MHETPTRSARPAATGFLFPAVAAELEAAAAAYAPAGAMHVLATIEGLPAALTSVAGTFRILAERCDTAFPVHQRVGEALNEVFRLLLATIPAAEEVGKVFRTQHAADITRHEDPRTGEPMWDTTRNTDADPAHRETPRPAVPPTGVPGADTHAPSATDTAAPAKRDKPRPGDEVQIDGAPLTLWAPAPHPATWWAVDRDGRPHLLDGRKGAWTRSPRTITFFKPGDRVRARGPFRPPLIGTVTSTYYRASRDDNAVIYVHFDGHDRIDDWRACDLIPLGTQP